MVQELCSSGAFDDHSSHVGHVEDACVFSDLPAFCCDSFVPDWQVVACVFYNVSMLRMVLVDLCLLTHLSCRLLGCELELGERVFLMLVQVRVLRLLG